MTGDYIRRQEERERELAIDADRNKWLVPFAAGMGAIGLGAFLLKKRVAEGGELMSNMFNFLGLPKGASLASDGAANAGRASAVSNTTGLRSILNASYDINRNRLNIGPIDLIDDLRNSVELMGNNEGSIARHIADRTVEYINRETAKFGNNTGYFTQGLQRVTAEQVLKDQTTWSKVLGSEQVSVLQKAKELDLIKSSTVLDKKLYFNPKTNEALDFRLRNIFTTVTTTDVGGVTKLGRSLKLDMFGQGELIASMFGRARGIGVAGPGSGYQGSRVVIGGNAYGYRFNTKTQAFDEVLLAKDQILKRTGSPLELMAASEQGRIDYKLPRRSGVVGSMMGWMERNLGIGTAFATRPGFAQRWVTDPLRRLRALRSGEGVVFKSPLRRRGDSKLGDALFGAEIETNALRTGTTIPIEGGGKGYALSEVTGSTYSIPNRLAVIFGFSDEHSVIKASQYREYVKGNRHALVSDDMIVPIRSGSRTVKGRVIPERSSVRNMTDIVRDDLSATGFLSDSPRYAFYTESKTSLLGMKSGLLTDARRFAAYSLYRINKLASESLLGIGFKPSHKISSNLFRLGAIPVAYEAARQSGMYADYLMESVTGVSPIKTAASLYAGARLAQQKLRELTGIQQSSAFMEKYFPGSVDSEGSTVIRSVIAPFTVANVLFGKGRYFGALAGALGTYAAIGGPEPGQETSELYREYTGDKLVPIRKGAFWGMGYTPFFGGRVERYGPSWYAKATSDYREKSIYGSKEEYFQYHANVFGIPLPTPSNLFGLRNILNPYRMEELNYENRPYPVTAHPISRFPIIGPVLGATVGELLKPTVYRQPDELPLLKANLAPRGLTPSMARTMGIPAMNATAYEAQDPTDIKSLVARQANIATEPLGVYKFVMEFFGVSTKPEIGTELAMSDMVGAPGRELYDSTLAGAFGQTEFIRRFMLGDYSAQYRRAAMINPIRNAMPDWLPGAYSASSADQSYFIDFTQGDPYVKIKDGEARLPGPGYEALHGLHSGQRGVYSDVDRFMILADVAPYSAAYKQYERKVLSMDLAPEWETKVQETIEQRSQVVGIDDRYKRYEEDIINLNLGVFADSIYAPIRKAYDFLTHDVLAEIPYLGSKFFPFRNPYEQYRKLYVEGSEYASWDRPWEGILRPMAYDMALEDPVTAAGKGATLGFLMSGPMRWFTPLRGLVGAPGHTLNPLTVGLGAAAGAGLSMARISAGYSQDMMPFHIRQESEAIDYMDKIAYIKGRMVEEAGGGSQFANRTMVGAQSSRNWRSALPRSADRRYFDYFASEDSQAIRPQIIQGLPDFMSEGLERTWNQDFNTRDEADLAALDFVNTNEIPDPSWLGWRPDVSAAATKLKFVQGGVNGISDNIHRFGFFESHEVDLKTRLRDFNGQSINYVQSPIHTSFNSFIRNQVKNVRAASSSSMMFSTPNGARRDITVYQDNDQQLLNYIRRR